ncbi:hypothetical protein GCM10023187_45390 [Nibrella viscosa]|uniref:Uncharacterized protein n=1 Tax=Nibrella viscosa TaxID=1084524 RepID=A0ABP8KTT1_9BACT
MKTQWLFPHRFRLIGWLILIPSVALGLAYMYAEFHFEFLTLSIAKGKGFLGSDLAINLTDEVAALGVIAGLLMIGFSKETIEDEMVSQMRLEALQWSIYVNYIVLAIAILFVHGERFFDVLIYNMFTMLIVFVIRFNMLLYRNSRVLAL